MTSERGAETWRVVLRDGSVREIVVSRHEGQWSAEDPVRHGVEFGVVPWVAVVRLTLRWTEGAREILAPGEPTRAEAVAAERERCAGLCDEVAAERTAMDPIAKAATVLAAKIRAGGV